MINRRDFAKLGLGVVTVAQHPEILLGQSKSSNNPLESSEIRRVGRRLHGSYWGHGAEKIDLLSGNLCYSLPLLHVQSRRLHALLKASYNSQLWSQDASGARHHGFDVGYGYGWRIQFASIVPRVKDDGSVTGYTFIDGSGTEYDLTAVGDRWISLNGAYATWDPTAKTLSLRDGTSFLFGCTSASGEADSGTLYPTLLQCSNGNQVVVRYLPGVGQVQANSSARIAEIVDARSIFSTDGPRSYAFAYSNDSIPHLQSISSSVATPETFSFSYSAGKVGSPFASTENSGKSAFLMSSIQEVSGHSETFKYNGYGELVRLKLKHGGVLAWHYSTVNFSSGASIREVANRRMFASESSDDAQLHTLSRDPSDGQGDVHSSAILTEHNNSSRRIFQFTSDKQSLDCGLLASVSDYSGSKLLRHRAVKWARTESGAPYVSSVERTLDPGTADQKTNHTDWAYDGYGNLLYSQHYTYDAPDTPDRRVVHTYLTEQPYLDKHILNRLVSTTITSREETITTVQNQYDTTPVVSRDDLTQHDSTRFGSSLSTRGNLTEQVSHGIYRKLTYDVTGHLASAEDVNGVKTSIEPASGTNNTRAGSIIPNGDASLGAMIEYSGGLPTKTTLSNGARHSWTYDALGRIATATSPTGSVSAISHQANPTAVTVTKNGQWTKKTMDGFGRVTKVEKGDATGTRSVQEHEYAPAPHSHIGKLSRASLSHSPDTDPVWTNYSYDDLGRASKQTLSSSRSSKTIRYAGNAKTVTDPAGRWKRLIHDSYGRLTKVVMPAPDGGADQETTYTYNTLGKLVGVSMPRARGTQSRSFGYDSAGRVIMRHHAESGKRRLVYNTDGTLASKTDAKGQTEQFTRDSLKRVTSVKRYDAKGVLQPNDSVAYYYDQNPFDSGFSQNVAGRLAAVQWGSASTLPGLVTEMYSYTVAGQVAAKRIRINRGKNDVDLDMSCSYDDEGRLATMNYPSGGPSLVHSYDPLGRLVGINSDTLSVVKDVAYNANGQMTSLKLLASADGQYMVENRQYDEQNRLNRLTTGPADAASTSDAIPKVDLQYAYRSEDGRLQSEADHIEGATVGYEYDIQGRLSSAASSDQSWGLVFQYDGFGNRVSQSVTEGEAFSHQTDHDPATNWMLNDDTAYDANGNIISLPFMNLTYDVLNRVKQVSHSINGRDTFAYDHKNLRIWAKTANSREYVYFYHGGKLLGTYVLKTDASGTISCVLNNANIYFGKRIVKSRGEALVIDRLGATRAWTSKDGARTTKYLPFGEELKRTSDDIQKFGGYQRDGVSGLDYAQNRYYSSTLGRFITPDPYEKSAHPTNPNSWNRYAFVNNDPINRVDPNGLNDTPDTPATTGWGNQTTVFDANGAYETRLTNSNGQQLIVDFDANGTMNEIILVDANGNTLGDDTLTQFNAEVNNDTNIINNYIAAQQGVLSGEAAAAAFAAYTGLWGGVVGGTLGALAAAGDILRAQQQLADIQSWVAWLGNGGNVDH